MSKRIIKMTNYELIIIRIREGYSMRPIEREKLSEKSRFLALKKLL